MNEEYAEIVERKTPYIITYLLIVSETKRVLGSLEVYLKVPSRLTMNDEEVEQDYPYNKIVYEQYGHFHQDLTFLDGKSALKALKQQCLMLNLAENNNDTFNQYVARNVKE